MFGRINDFFKKPNIKKIVAGKKNFLMLFPYLNLKMFFPLYLLIHITMECNRRCSYCYQHDGSYGEGDISLELLENVLKERSKMFFKPHVHLFGGEPLFFKDIDALFLLLKKYKTTVSLTTNGDLISQKVGLFQSPFVRQVNISLNPPTGKDLKMHLVKMLESVRAVKDANPSLVVNLNYNLNPDDYLLLYDVFSFFKKNTEPGLIDVFVVQHFMHKEIKSVCEFDCVKIREMFELIKGAKTDFDVVFLPEVDAIETYYEGKKFMSRKCYVPFFGLSIYPKGEVKAGGGVFGCNVALGNLQEDTLLNIWKGKKQKHFNDGIRKKLASDCIRCCQKLYK